MISGINLQAVVEYTLKDDTEPKTMFKLGILPSDILEQVFSTAGEDKQVKMAFRILQLCLRGWENFGDMEYKTEKENVCNREMDVVPLELIRRIPLKVINELSVEILTLNGLSGQERKN